MTVLYDAFADQAQQFGHKPAIIVGEQSLTYQALLSVVDDWCEVISASCPDQKPRVALITDNLIQAVSVALALAKLGGVCIPCNAQLQLAQLRRAFTSCDVNLVITSVDLADRIGAGLAEDFCVLTGDSPMAASRNARGLATHSPEGLDADFLISLSSGSTGAPKPIVLSQPCKLARARQTQNLYGVDEQDVVLCASPFFHSLGQRLCFVPLTCGATLVGLERFTPDLWVGAVAAQKVSFVIAVSAHLYALKDALMSSDLGLSSLRVIVSSSAPIDADFKQKLFNHLGCEFHEIYGATEVAIVTNLSPQQAATKHHTVGLPCGQVQVRIVNAAGRDCQQGEIGEIIVHTPLLFSHYYKRTDITAASSQAGWFFTGDLGKIDHQNYLTYVDRKKDVIICGGINVYPKDIEAVVLSHPGVEEVAVVGLADKRLGEVIVAVCVGQVGPSDEITLRQLCNKQLAAFQRPLKYFFWKSLPLTHSGKVSKIAIREALQQSAEDLTGSLSGILYGPA
jgi:acyl-CoA synthetase (AMP-forming)/AMP-acid ligase II